VNFDPFFPISRNAHKPVHSQQRLVAMGIKQLRSRPRHPQTCGKLERYHRTFKEFYADEGPTASIDELQAATRNRMCRLAASVYVTCC
jgi:hypothetical protein